MADEAEVVKVIEDEIDKEQDEFEAAFNEAAKAREGGADEDTTPAKGAGDLDKPASTPAEEKPENVVDQDADAKDAPGAGKEEPAGDADPYEGMSEDVKKRYQNMEKNNGDLKHRIDSDDGRVGAFQRKINNLEHQIADIQKKPGQPSTEEITAAMANEESWKTLEEDYPEIAGAINKRFEAQQQQVDSKLAPVIEKQEHDAAATAETAQQENYDVVAKDYPTWQTAVQQQDFQDWMESQSPGVKALAGSDDARDASLLISKYDEHRVANNLPTLKANPDPDNGGVDKKAKDEVTKRRERQLEDGTTIESKNAKIDPNAESGSDFENAFNAFAKSKEAKNRA